MGAVMILFCCSLLVSTAHGAKLDDLERVETGWDPNSDGPIGSYFEAPLPSGGTYRAFAGFGSASQITQGQHVLGSSFSTGQGSSAPGTYTAFAGFGTGNEGDTKGSFISASGVPTGASGTASGAAGNAFTVGSRADNTRSSTAIGTRLTSGTLGSQGLTSDRRLLDNSLGSRFTSSSGSHGSSGGNFESAYESGNSLSSGSAISSGGSPSQNDASALRKTTGAGGGVLSGNRFGSQGISSGTGTIATGSSNLSSGTSGTRANAATGRGTSTYGSSGSSGSSGISTEINSEFVSQLGSVNSPFPGNTAISPAQTGGSLSSASVSSGNRFGSGGSGFGIKASSTRGNIFSPGSRTPAQGSPGLSSFGSTSDSSISSPTGFTGIKSESSFSDSDNTLSSSNRFGTQESAFVAGTSLSGGENRVSSEGSGTGIFSVTNSGVSAYGNSGSDLGSPSSEVGAFSGNRVGTTLQGEGTFSRRPLDTSSMLGSQGVNSGTRGSSSSENRSPVVSSLSGNRNPSFGIPTLSGLGSPPFGNEVQSSPDSLVTSRFDSPSNPGIIQESQGSSVEVGSLVTGGSKFSSGISTSGSSPSTGNRASTFGSSGSTGLSFPSLSSGLLTTTASPSSLGYTAYSGSTGSSSQIGLFSSKQPTVGSITSGRRFESQGFTAGALGASVSGNTFSSGAQGISSSSVKRTPVHERPGSSNLGFSSSSGRFPSFTDSSGITSGISHSNPSYLVSSSVPEGRAPGIQTSPDGESGILPGSSGTSSSSVTDRGEYEYGTSGSSGMGFPSYGSNKLSVTESSLTFSAGADTFSGVGNSSPGSNFKDGVGTSPTDGSSFVPGISDVGNSSPGSNFEDGVGASPTGGSSFIPGISDAGIPSPVWSGTASSSDMGSSSLSTLVSTSGGYSGISPGSTLTSNSNSPAQTKGSIATKPTERISSFSSGNTFGSQRYASGTRRTSTSVSRFSSGSGSALFTGGGKPVLGGSGTTSLGSVDSSSIASGTGSPLNNRFNIQENVSGSLPNSASRFSSRIFEPSSSSVTGSSSQSSDNRQPTSPGSTGFMSGVAPPFGSDGGSLSQSMGSFLKNLPAKGSSFISGNRFESQGSSTRLRQSSSSGTRLSPGAFGATSSSTNIMLPHNERNSFSENNPDFGSDMSSTTFAVSNAGGLGSGARRPGFSASKPIQGIFGSPTLDLNTNLPLSANSNSNDFTSFGGASTFRRNAGSTANSFDATSPFSDVSSGVGEGTFRDTSRGSSFRYEAGTERRGIATGSSATYGSGSRQSSNFHSSSSSYGKIQFGGTIHAGFCPAITNNCTTQEGNLKKCVNDESCGPSEKCCFDTCNIGPKHHFVCKEAQAQS